MAMATPTFSGLPIELLCQIILHVMPEGFESLVLTCTKLYELCTPFIERHKRLTSQFRKFTYSTRSHDESSPPIGTAFGLIHRIAIEPMVARYIRQADLNADTWVLRVRLNPHVSSVQSGGPVVTLFADSPYLRQADLDWTEYYCTMEQEITSSTAYSQHAAAFILTLLPNVETLRLPSYWKPVGKATELLNVVVHRAKQTSDALWDRPSLAHVTKFESFNGRGRGWFDLYDAIPFLALPRVRSFRGPRTDIVGDACMALPPKDLFLGCGEALEDAHLLRCCLDDMAIAKFLRHAPRLKRLVYSHLSTGDRRDWNIREFVASIERESGSHLEELSVTIRELRGSIIPGKGSMRGFQRLRRLELPFGIAVADVADAASRVATPTEGILGQRLNRSESPLTDLIPASLCELQLVWGGTAYHEQALKVLFRSFAKQRESRLPALQRISVFCPLNPTDAYKEECEKLAAATEEAGVGLCLDSTIAWGSSLIIDSDPFFEHQNLP